MSRFSQFDNLISGIYRSISKIKSMEMESLGLRGSQVRFLYQLYIANEGKSATEMRVLCDEDKAAISRIIKELEAGEYIFIDEQEGQRYKNPIKLSEKGKKIGKVVADKIDRYYALGNVGIKENERERFYEQLILISQNLQKIIDKNGGKYGN